MPCKKVSAAEDAKLLYVAMTRATDELLMTYHVESEFTIRLERELAVS
jgi:superfamily I DNA/RNA helicase